MTDAAWQSWAQLGVAGITGVVSIVTLIYGRAKVAAVIKKTDEQTVALSAKVGEATKIAAEVKTLVDGQNTRNDAIIEKLTERVADRDKTLLEKKTEAVEVEHKAEVDKARADERSRLDPEGDQTAKG